MTWEAWGWDPPAHGEAGDDCDRCGEVLERCVCPEPKRTDNDCELLEAA